MHSLKPIHQTILFLSVDTWLTVEEFGHITKVVNQNYQILGLIGIII